MQPTRPRARPSPQRRRGAKPLRGVPPVLQRSLAEAGPVSRARVVAAAVLLSLLAKITGGYLLEGLNRPQRTASAVQGLLENANLVFHEAGHWIFGLLGIDLLTTAGGSLMQLLVPAACAVAFLSRHPDPFAAGFAGWWTGQSLVNLAPYIADARAQRLVLLGGVTGGERPGHHDWNNLLGRLGWLPADTLLGWLAHLAGIALMLASVGLAVQVLRAQWRGASGIMSDHEAASARPVFMHRQLVPQSDGGGLDSPSAR